MQEELITEPHGEGGGPLTAPHAPSSSSPSYPSPPLADTCRSLSGFPAPAQKRRSRGGPACNTTAIWNHRAGTPITGIVPVICIPDQQCALHGAIKPEVCQSRTGAGSTSR